MLQPNDIEIIELLLTNRYKGGEFRKVKEELFFDDEFRMLYEELEIIILAINASAVKTTMQQKMNNLRSK